MFMPSTEDLMFGMRGATPGLGAGIGALGGELPISAIQGDAPLDIGQVSIPGMGGIPSILPGIGGAGGGGFFGNMNGMQKAGAIIGGLASLANIFAGFKALSMAKKNMRFQQDFANRNYANQLKSYNTALADRARARGFTEGQSSSQVDEYYNKNKLGG